MRHNNNCDGSTEIACRGEEVRLYPLWGGGNLILCAAHWEHENAYRADMGREYAHPEEWPVLDWATAKVYPEE
jgi:hypothetical protein